jgi:hypothetical protein
MQASMNILTLRRFAACVSVMFTFIVGVLCDQHIGPSNGTAASQNQAQLIQPYLLLMGLLGDFGR